MTDKFNHHGKLFTADEKVTMARMAAQRFQPLDIAAAIGTTKVRVAAWLRAHPLRVDKAVEDLEREAKVAERAVKRDSFIAAPTLAKLMGGR